MEYDGPYEVKKLTSNDPFEQYFQKVVRVLVIGDRQGIVGKLTSVSDRFLTLEHLDGRTTLIKPRAVATITELPGRC